MDSQNISPINASSPASSINPVNQVNNQSIPPQNSNKKNSVIVITITVLILIIAGLAAYYFLSQKTQNNINEPLPEVSLLSTEDKEKINNIYTELKDNSGLTAEQVQGMNLIASDRTVEIIDTSSMKYSEVHGYKFKSPWGEGAISEKTKNSPEIKQLEFENGKKIIFICWSHTPRQDFEDAVTVHESMSKEDVDQILRFLGTKADSGYEYTDFVLSMDNESIKSVESVENAEVLSKLLYLKSQTVPYAKQVYRFNTGSMKGFQYSDYSTSLSVNIEFFPNNLEKCILLAPEASNLTQRDVDIIISTFTKAQ